MIRRFFVSAVLIVSSVSGAELRQETVSAWKQYVQSADATMQSRLRPGHAFMWVDEAPGRRQQLRAGEILVTGVGESNPKKVPAGLIHHWMGAVFVPNAKIDDVLGVVRDYPHYKDYYNPSVIDSHAIHQTPSSDRFSMLLMNKSFFLKTALDSEYESSYVQAGSHRWYSIATAVRVQEVEDYGEAGQHELPADEGNGYVWRMHSIARYEEADGGVYIELEAIALSRDVPIALRWMVDPIVRRVSRGAIFTSLQQTLGAVSSSGQFAGRPVTNPGLTLGFQQSSFVH